jgi:FtsK/SpoIIIE family
LAGRPKALLVGYLCLLGALSAFTGVTFWLGAWFLLCGAWSVIVASLSLWGRHVAPDRGATSVRHVADGDSATSATPDATILSLTKERVVAALRAHSLINETEDIELSGGRAEPNGCSVVVKLPPSKIAATILTARAKIAGGLDSDVPLVAVEPVKGSVRSFRLREYATDPMDSSVNPSPPSPLVHAERTWVNKPIRLGRTLDGRTVAMRCTDGAHLLTAGGTGSGKSNACRVRGLAFALDPDATQTVIDAKGSPALRLFRPVAAVFSGTDPMVQRAAAKHMRQLATTELNRRMEVLARYAEENPGLVADDGIDDAMARNRDLDVPYRQVWIDECHTVYAYSAPLDPSDPDGEKCGPVIAAAVKTLITQGRSLGITVDQSTQRPSATNIDTDIRAIATGKLCGSLEEDADARMVFGSRFRERGIDPVHGIQGHVHVGWMFLTGAAKAEPKELSTVLVHCDLADVTATKMAIDRAYRVCAQVRPEILPDGPTDPRPAPAPAEELPGLAADAPERLEELQNCFSGAERELLSVTIIGRLREEYPADEVYRALSARSMNAFLKPFGLRTTSVREGDKKGKGLTLSALIEARNACLDSPGDAAPLAEAITSGAAAGHAETGPDQGCPAAPQSGAPAEIPPDPPSPADTPEPAGQRGNGRRHLGQVPLPVVVSGPAGSFR